MSLSFILGAELPPPQGGQSTILLKNHLKVFISIQIDTLNPNVHVISSDSKYVKRYGGF